MLLVAGVYFFLGIVGLKLAVVPGYASAVFPAAGVGMAVVIRGGRGLLPGVWLGSLGVNLWIAGAFNVFNGWGLLAPALIGLGSTLQVWLALVLVERQLKPGWLGLENDADIIGFLLLAGPLACLFSATWGNAVLAAFHAVPIPEIAFNWWNWWVGDSIGVVLFAPMTLLLLQHRRPLGKQRLLQVAAPTLVFIAGVLVVFVFASAREIQHFKQRIEEQGSAVASQLRAKISAGSDLVASLNSFVQANPVLSDADFQEFTRKSRLAHPELLALSWNPLIDSASRNRFEVNLSKELAISHFQITQLDRQDRLVPAETRDIYVPVRYITPWENNRMALGYDIASDPVISAAVAAAIRSGKQAATPPIRRMQAPEAGLAVLLLDPAYKYRPGVDGKSTADLGPVSGLAVGVFRVDDMITPVPPLKLPPTLTWTLEDPGARPESRLLYPSSPPDINRELSAFAWRADIPIGDRFWRLSVYPTQAYFKADRAFLSWLVLVGGLALASMVQAFLLAMTGRTSAVQRQVIAQTLSISRQKAFLSLGEEAGGIGCWEADLIENKQTWSKNCTTLIGFPLLSEPTWEDFLAVVHPADRQRVIDATQSHIENATKYDVEYRAFVANGETRWLRSCGQVERDAEGKPILMRGIVQDINERVLADLALSRSESQFRSLFENMASGFVLHEIVTDQQGEPIDYMFLAANAAYEAITGFDRQTIIGKCITEVYPKIHEDSVDWIQVYGQVALHGGTRHVESFAEGLQRWFQITAYRPAPRQFAVLVDDITHRKQSEEKLQLAASVFTNTHDGIVVTDPKGRILDINPAFTQITGFSRGEVLGQYPSILKSGHQDGAFYAAMWRRLRKRGAWSGELWNRKKDGSEFPEWLTVSAVPDVDNCETAYYIGTFSDISLLKRHEQELQRMAYYDPLTSIPNRVLLADRIHQAIAHSRRHRSRFAVCYLDLDGFKPINDEFGHDVGDTLLVKMTERIKTVLRESDTVARLGGDEFAIILQKMEQTAECLAMIERILGIVNEPVNLNGNIVKISASIGLTLFPEDDADADVLLRHADQAMYQAKQGGKNCYRVFDMALDQRLHQRLEFLKAMESGLGDDEFLLYYQPKVYIDSGKLMGAEALIRWRHPQKGLLAPGQFLPAVENSDLEIRIGQWVIESALGQLARWQSAGLELEVSINIAGHHLQQRDFVGELERRLRRFPALPAGRLQIEVLETAALKDIEQIAGIIQSCQRLGVGFALDDFGTGYSSLNYLRHLPAETLKIDQTFVRDMLEDAGDYDIVEGVIALANTFKRQTVAEGVETVLHLQSLRTLGCHIGQGHGIAQPMPAEEFFEWSKGRGA